MAVRRTGRIGAAVVAAVVLGVSAGACASGSGDGGGARGGAVSSSYDSTPVVKVSALHSSLAKLPAQVEGGVIVVGDPDAPHTVSVFEDVRCPYCKKFEEGGARALVDAAAEGKVRIEYTIASFLDGRLGGTGSVKAANALRASVEEGRFAEFHAAVFASQPEDETTDGYTDDFLLDIAGQVKGLRSAEFDRAVRTQAYEGWVADAARAFEDSGVQGTPTVLIDGEKPAGPADAMYDEAQFGRVLAKAGITG